MADSPVAMKSLITFAGQGLDAVLEALGIPMQGTLQVKRQALKLHIGLPTIS